jgi:hypothetical protein
MNNSASACPERKDTGCLCRVARTRAPLSSTARRGCSDGADRPTSLSDAAANLDALVSQPRHVTLGLRHPGPHNARTQPFRAVHRSRVAQDLPLEALGGEPVADLEIHGQDRRGVRLWGGLWAWWAAAASVRVSRPCLAPSRVSSRDASRPGSGTLSDMAHHREGRADDDK